MTMKKTLIVATFGLALIIGGAHILKYQTPKTTTTEKTAKSQKEEKTKPASGEEKKEQEEDKIIKINPKELKQCPTEIFTEPEKCENLPEKTVCGFDRTTYKDGKEETHALEYRNVCRYCNFFGETGIRNLNGIKMEALGYKEGPCE